MFKGFGQHDAHEFLCAAFDALEAEATACRLASRSATPHSGHGVDGNSHQTSASSGCSATASSGQSTRCQDADATGERASFSGHDASLASQSGSALSCGVCPVESSFGFRVKTTLRCKQCANSSCSIERFSHLSLTIPASLAGNSLPAGATTIDLIRTSPPPVLRRLSVDNAAIANAPASPVCTGGGLSRNLFHAREARPRAEPASPGVEIFSDADRDRTPPSCNRHSCVPTPSCAPLGTLADTGWTRPAHDARPQSCNLADLCEADALICDQENDRENRRPGLYGGGGGLPDVAPRDIRHARSRKGDGRGHGEESAPVQQQGDEDATVPSWLEEQLAGRDTATRSLDLRERSPPTPPARKKARRARGCGSPIPCSPLPAALTAVPQQGSLQGPLDEAAVRRLPALSADRTPPSNEEWAAAGCTESSHEDILATQHLIANQLFANDEEHQLALAISASLMDAGMDCGGVIANGNRDVEGFQDCVGDAGLGSSTLISADMSNGGDCHIHEMILEGDAGPFGEAHDIVPGGPALSFAAAPPAPPSPSFPIHGRISTPPRDGSGRISTPPRDGSGVAAATGEDGPKDTQPANSSSTPVSELARRFFDDETREWRCGQCGCDDATASQGLLSPLPPNLLLHLKRFHSDMNTGSTSKLHTLLHLDDRLDLTAHLDDGSNGRHGAATAESLHAESSGCGTGDRAADDDAPGRLGVHCEYRLRALVTHHGDACWSGHYTCMARLGDGDEWVCYDDRQVTVLRTNPTAQSDVRRGAYLLLYERIDHSSTTGAEMVD